MKVTSFNLTELRKACLSNAKDLLLESKLLYKNKRYARSIFLAISSYEEGLKTGLMHTLSAGLIDKNKFKEIFKRHSDKFLLAYAVIRTKIYDNTDEIKVDYVVPKKNKVKPIINDRVNSLYVNLIDKKILLPKKNSYLKAKKYIKLAEQLIKHEEFLDIFIQKRGIAE